MNNLTVPLPPVEVSEICYYEESKLFLYFKNLPMNYSDSEICFTFHVCQYLLHHDKLASTNFNLTICIAAFGMFGNIVAFYVWNAHRGKKNTIILLFKYIAIWDLMRLIFGILNITVKTSSKELKTSMVTLMMFCRLMSLHSTLEIEANKYYSVLNPLSARKLTTRRRIQISQVFLGIWCGVLQSLKTSGLLLPDEQSSATWKLFCAFDILALLSPSHLLLGLNIFLLQLLHKKKHVDPKKDESQRKHQGYVLASELKQQQTTAQESAHDTVQTAIEDAVDQPLQHNQQPFETAPRDSTHCEKRFYEIEHNDPAHMSDTKHTFQTSAENEGVLIPTSTEQPLPLRFQPNAQVQYSVQDSKSTTYESDSRFFDDQSMASTTSVLPKSEEDINAPIKEYPTFNAKERQTVVPPDELRKKKMSAVSTDKKMELKAAEKGRITLVIMIMGLITASSNIPYTVVDIILVVEDLRGLILHFDYIALQNAQLAFDILTVLSSSIKILVYLTVSMEFRSLVKRRWKQIKVMLRACCVRLLKTFR